MNEAKRSQDAGIRADESTQSPTAPTNIAD